MPVPTNRQKAEAEAIIRAATSLAGVDLSARCRRLGLASVDSGGRLPVRLFGQDVLVIPPDFQVVIASTGQPAKPSDRILALHYLQHDAPVSPTGTLITFRDLPGGQFYFGPFCARSVNPLVKRIGNDLELLRLNLGRFDWQPAALGDFAARIHVVGCIEVTLVYHTGDEEMGPAAEILFDRCIKRVFCTEDAAAIASRICFGLL